MQVKSPVKECRFTSVCHQRKCWWATSLLFRQKVHHQVDFNASLLYTPDLIPVNITNVHPIVKPTTDYKYCQSSRSFLGKY